EYVAEGFDPWISSAPAQIVLCVDRNAYLGRYSEPDKAGADGEPSTESDWPVPYWWVDAGASLMAMLMAAVDEGLAAGFLGAHAIETLADVLAIPVDVDVVGVLTIGSPRSDRRSASLVRGWRDRDSVVFYDEWRSGSA
ncbi:MAG: nitroreductase family protein, partial [Actinomycetia bacterium]|nr:nitroreductase family protein [Actinomycetes bacterium]